MREVANRLEHMGWINRDLQLAVAITGPKSDRLCELRADFSFEGNQLLNQLTGMLAQLDHAQLASRLIREFVAMHQMLSQHQQHWSPSQIARDPEGFASKARQMNAAIINFIEGALEAISAAVSPKEPTSPFAPQPGVRLTRTG